MNARPTILLLCFLLLGSCSSGSKLSPTDAVTQGFAELQIMAGTVITDSVRREKYLRHSKALEVELRSFEDYAGKAIRDYRAVFIDYDADAARLKQLAANFREEQKKARGRFIDAHLGMASSVTADEWKQLSRHESKIIEDLAAAAARSVE